MDAQCMEFAKKLISSTYVDQASECKRQFSKRVRVLLEKRKLPDEGWNDSDIEMLLHELSSMDSNNFPNNCGVGEREGRIYSSIVARRHFRLGHGIGRSGDIAEVQPKAAGSSLINKLTNSMMLDVLKLSGASLVKSCFVVPVATGMALVLCLLAVKQVRPKSAKYVLWPRIDQKSCIKCISTAGFEPVIIENKLVGDELRTDLDELCRQVEILGPENIACVLTTTSCFAPRVPDSLDEVSKLCKEKDIPHVVNNAYGVQSSKCMHLIQQAYQLGRIDAFVQSADKNFLVPVGGAIIAGFDEKFIDMIRQTYPGRGSSTPSVDLFITLLSLGINGFRRLLDERKEMLDYLRSCLTSSAQKYEEKLLQTKHNNISVAMSLSSISGAHRKDITELGSMLFRRGVSGTRVICSGDEKIINGRLFMNWGSHSNHYPCPYITAAAAIGMTKVDCDRFIKRLESVMDRNKRTMSKDEV